MLSLQEQRCPSTTIQGSLKLPVLAHGLHEQHVEPFVVLVRNFSSFKNGLQSTVQTIHTLDSILHSLSLVGMFTQPTIRILIKVNDKYFIRYV